jgi:hypothetical protein
MATKGMSNIFGVFSAIEQRPVIRTWARSRAEAEKKLEEVRAKDAQSERGQEEEYYVVQLSAGELKAYQNGGSIPSELR